MLFAALYTYLDLMGRKSVLLLALPLGRNALFIYVFATIKTALMQTIYLSDGEKVYDFLMSYSTVYLSPMWEKITFTLLFLALWVIIAYILHKKRIYIKL